jgi:hypothetical protein
MNTLPVQFADYRIKPDDETPGLEGCIVARFGIVSLIRFIRK